MLRLAGNHLNELRPRNCNKYCYWLAACSKSSVCVVVGCFMVMDHRSIRVKEATAIININRGRKVPEQHLLTTTRHAPRNSRPRQVNDHNIHWGWGCVRSGDEGWLISNNNVITHLLLIHSSIISGPFEPRPRLLPLSPKPGLIQPELNVRHARSSIGCVWIYW